jgi:cytochrome c553
MTRSSLRYVLPGAAALAALAAHVGGWATITLEDLPEHAVAGQPVTLTYTVRQHGVELMSGLDGRVEARSGRLTARAPAAPGDSRGRYVAGVTFPQPGSWTVTIHSGFGRSSVTLLPLRVIAAGAPAPLAVPAAERGRQLFVAKGCQSCHLHGDVAGSGTAPVGPELTGRRFAAEYLQRFLADPSIRRPARGTGKGMPDLDLDDREIAALAAFINTERQAAR